MSLPRYHDDSPPRTAWNRYQDRLIRSPDGSLRVWRLWASLYDALRNNPFMPVTALRDIAYQAFFYEDDEMGHIPRVTVPIAAVVGIVRQAIKTNPRGARPPVPAKFKRIVRDTFRSPEKITGEKLDFEESTQFSEEPVVMPDQKGSLKTILQGGITPFTNMRPANIKLGDSVYSRKNDPIRDLANMNGTASFGFGFRFTSDVSDERKSAIMVFRHNKKGKDYSQTKPNPPFSANGDFVVPATGYMWVNNSGSSYTYDGKQYLPGQTVSFKAGHVITAAVAAVAAVAGVDANGDGDFDDAGDTAPVSAVSAVDADLAYPTANLTHSWGYADTVKVFPTQYNGASKTLNTVLLDPTDDSKNVTTPFEHIESGSPKIYLSALNRADLEDMSCQLNPMILTRQGEIDWLTGAHHQSTIKSLGEYDMRYPRSSATKGISKLRFGQLWLDQKHSHSQRSAIYDINALDSETLPRGTNEKDFGNLYKGSLGTSFQYDAVLKSGGVQFTCVNRGGSGCNVDVHLFKMKKKHIHTMGLHGTLNWAEIAKPYEDAYIKRAHEIVTADNLRGREPIKTDIWNKPKYPLLPGSRLMDAEDTFLNRVSKSSYYIPSQGRKNINIRFPGAKYNPVDVQSVLLDASNVETSPDYDEFTYFCLYSVTGEKSSAQYSTKNTAGTLVISLADLLTVSSQAAVSPPSSVSLPHEPSLPSIPLGYTSSPSGNIEYDKWVLEHDNWGYSTQEYMFYLDRFIDLESKSVTGWSVDDTEGPFVDGNPNVYSGRRYVRRIRLPLPSLDEWLAANYDSAYTEQGRSWKPSKPKVFKKRHWKNAIVGGVPLTPIDWATSTAYTAATWVAFDYAEWPVYQSQPASNSADPPVDVTPEFDPVDVEVMVRTNFFLFL